MRYNRCTGGRVHYAMSLNKWRNESKIPGVLACHVTLASLYNDMCYDHDKINDASKVT